MIIFVGFAVAALITVLLYLSRSSLTLAFYALLILSPPLAAVAWIIGRLGFWVLPPTIVVILALSVWLYNLVQRWKYRIDSDDGPGGPLYQPGGDLPDGDQRPVRHVRVPVVDLVGGRYVKNGVRQLHITRRETEKVEVENI